MIRKYEVFLVLISILVLSGCATVRHNTELESTGALKGSLAQTICNKAWEHFEETGEWYDAPQLARKTGLSVYNRDPENNFAIYIIEKPYYEIPETMDKRQTFAFYHHDFPDSSKYVYCRIYYNHGDRPFSCSIGDNGQAHDYALVLTAEEALVKFHKQAIQPRQYNIQKIIEKNAEKISRTSPNPTSKQLLYEYAKKLLGDFYADVDGVDPDTFRTQLEAYSTTLGRYIDQQDW